MKLGYCSLCGYFTVERHIRVLVIGYARGTMRGTQEELVLSRLVLGLIQNIVSTFHKTVICKANDKKDKA